MFSMVSQFSFPVSLIRLRGFLPGFYFSLTIPCSTKLTSKKRGNYNNVILRAESSQNRSHVTIIIQNFTLISLTSTITLHRVWLLFGALNPLFDLCTQLLLNLRTQPFTVYPIKLTSNLYTSRKDILLGYLQIVYLWRHEAEWSSNVI